MSNFVARTEFAAAVNQLAKERDVEPDVVLDTIKSAIIAAYNRDRKERGETIEEGMEYAVKLDPVNGAATVFSWPEGEEDKKIDVTPPGFGRIAAQTAKQVILQKIREAEKSATISHFVDKVGTLVNGMILRFDGLNIIVAVEKAEAVMPPHEQVPSENYSLNQRMVFYVDGIRDSMRGQEVVVSRSSKELVKLLFEREVPEVASSVVEIRSIAREPGARTKVAVYSNQSGVDPVGSCVGQKGVRVQAVIDELNGEKLDIIQYDDNPVNMITAAVAPAEADKVEVDEEKMVARVVVPDDQLSLAIGREGQNVRLAAKLTGFKLDIVGSSGAKPTSSEKHDADEGSVDAKKNELVESGLPSRIVSLLKDAGIVSLEDVKSKTDKELGAIKGIGKKAIEEIKKVTNS